MKRNDLRRVSCVGKVTFRTRADAEAAIQLQRERILFAEPMDIYECKFGRHLHMGHSPPPSQLSAILESFELNRINTQEV